MAEDLATAASDRLADVPTTSEPRGDVATVPLADVAATERLGADLALALESGDCIHLHGNLGAGKTSLARGLVRAMVEADVPQDVEVPSPTFTLAQSYDGRVPVLHVDLYRIEDPAETEELGLDEALEDGVLLVEWPERGGDRLPPATLHVELAPDGAGRVATLHGDALPRAVRSLELRAFLSLVGHPDAMRRHLTGDASARSYETVHGWETPRILMNAPRMPDGPPIHDGQPYSRVAHLAEDVAPFVAVAEALRRDGFAAPRIYAADMEAGLLLIENLGTDAIVADGAPIRERYEASARMLAELHARDHGRTLLLPDGRDYVLPDYDRAAIQVEVSLLADWYARDVLDRELSAAERERFVALWDELIDRLSASPKTLVLRDFHSPNIVWREDRAGLDRIGLIDFQDAVMGPAAYDLASLAQDARVDVPADLEAHLVDLYCETARPSNEAGLREAYAIMAAERASKILGIFVRLDLRDGEPSYRAHLPRMRDYMARTLAHPALAELADFYAEAFDLRPS